MKLTALAVVILALGIAVGFALAEGSLGGPASAVPQCPGPSAQCPTPTPAPPQQREDQITMFANAAYDVALQGGSFQRLTGVSVGLDASNYPTSTTFRLEATLLFIPGTGTVGPRTRCFRLFDVTADVPVTASEACHTYQGPLAEEVRQQSTPFSLPAESHEYTLQTNCTGAGCDNEDLGSAVRIIAEWTE